MVPDVATSGDIANQDDVDLGTAEDDCEEGRAYGWL